MHLAIALLAVLSAPARADERADARRHYLAGVEAFEAGDYRLAIDEFRAADGILPHPNNLYNIARSLERLGDIDGALAAWAAYLELVPEHAEALAPEIARLEAIRAPAPPPEPAAASAEEIARLRAIAAELEALGRALAEREVAGSGAAGSGAAGSGSARSGAVGSGPAGSGAVGSGSAGSDGAGSGAAGSGAVGSGSAGSEVAEASDPGSVSAVGSAGAADGAPGALQLSEAYQREVVTASRYGQSPLDSPSTVAILSAQDIRLSGATSFGDLLRRVAGVDVMFLSASQPDVAIRGFNKEFSNKVLVLVDGRSVYQEYLGAPLWAAIPVTLEEVERIEVIRGPGAAVYGANAVSGVINIITRTPGEGPDQVRVEGGSPGYGRGSVVLGGRRGDTRYRASASYRQTGRWSTEVEGGGAEVDWDPGQTEAMEISQGSLRLDRTFLGGRGFASLSAGYAGGFSEFYAIGTLGDFYLDFDAPYLRGDLALGSWRLRAFYNGLDSRVGPWSTVPGSRADTTLNSTLRLDTTDLELDYDAAFVTGALSHRLTGGLGYRLRAVDWPYLSNPIVGTQPEDPIVEHQLSAFIQDEISLERLRAVASLRVDRHPLVPLNETISPRLAAIARVAPSTSLRLSGGTSFRNPSALESYVDLQQPSSVDGIYVDTLGDTSLLPERILTGELGLHDESSDLHQADVAVYVNRLSSLVVLGDAVPKISDYSAESAGFSAGTTGFVNDPASYLGYGLEVDGRLFPVDGLDLFANAALQSVSRSTPTDGGEPLVERDGSSSGLKLNAGVAWRSPARVDLSLSAHYVSAQEWRLRTFDEQGQIIEVIELLPARSILAARIAARPLPDESLELSLSAWNLADLLGEARFREHPKGQLVGSRLYAGITYRF